MKWKEKDHLSWCCINRRRNDGNNNNDDDSKYANNQAEKVVLTQRSREQVLLPVEKVKKTKERKKGRKKRKKAQKYLFASFPSCSCLSYLRSLIMTTHHRMPIFLPRTYSIRKV